jgi:hypothetical protein
MAKPWRWVSLDIGIAADLPSGDKIAGAPQPARVESRDGAADPPGSRRLFCEVVRQRARQHNSQR